MTDPASLDITTQVLIQIRDEMRTMRASFDRRFDALEKRMETVETGLDVLGGRMDGFDLRLSALESRLSPLIAHAQYLGAKQDSSETRKAHHETEASAARAGVDLDANRLLNLEQTVYALGQGIDLLAERVTEVNQQGQQFEQIGRQLTDKIDLVQTHMDFLIGRMDAMEVRFDAFEDRAEDRFRQVLDRFGMLDTDLKKFASVSNAAFLHYADEMDKVRDRVTFLENNVPEP